MYNVFGTSIQTYSFPALSAITNPVLKFVPVTCLNSELGKYGSVPFSDASTFVKRPVELIL